MLFSGTRGETTMVDKVGFLITTTPGDWNDYIQAFTDVWVNRLGHSPGSIKKSGGAQGKEDKIREAAREFQTDGEVKVVVTAGTGAALICKAELTKPFVYAAVGDPGLSNLVPGVGNNFTGGNNRQAADAVVKARVKYMLDNGFKAPFMVLGNNAGGQEPFKTAMTRAYKHLHDLQHEVYSQTITPADDIPAMIKAFKTKTPRPIQSIYVCSDPYLTVHSKKLNDAAHDTDNGTLPYINTMFEIQEHVDAPNFGNAWFGSNFLELFETAARYAHEIMALGVPPAELPNYTAALSGGGAAHTGKKGSKQKPKKNKKKKKKMKTKKKK